MIRSSINLNNHDTIIYKPKIKNLNNRDMIMIIHKPKIKNLNNQIRSSKT